MSASPTKKCTPVSPWKKPNEIMQMHRLKVKKRALQARFNKVKVTDDNKSDNNCNKFTTDKKRRNPFLRDSDNTKRQKEDSICIDEDTSSCDNTLFKLLNLNKPTTIITDEPHQQQEDLLPNITQTLTELTIPGYNFIPIDWTIKTKMRFISKNKFNWNSNLKTSEEASGITGFVRCLDTTTSQSLDTSLNARAFQCCLIWQHPSLPWLQLFPRNNGGGKGIINNPDAIKSLHNDWKESFRSLFQLLRARQCPFFYFCGNSFTILFRAAGICGFNETHALLTPTTRGLRQTLRQEDIEFTMPLKIESDLGYETLDSDDHDQWLKDLGVDDQEIKKINNTQARKSHFQECAIDNSESSLICVEGVECQALFNFLINCKSSISVTGQLAGIPPTLLSPVAFRGATLQSLKARENKVSVDNETYASMDITGPILPNCVHSLAALISLPENEYSVTFENFESTKAFSKVKKKMEEKNGSVLFGQENLSDCGLSNKMMKHFCSDDPQHLQIIESLKFTGSQHLYSWT